MVSRFLIREDNSMIGKVNSVVKYLTFSLCFTFLLSRTMAQERRPPRQGMWLVHECINLENAVGLNLDFSF